MPKSIKITFFVFLMAMLWLPIIQEKERMIDETALKGAFVPPPEPEFSLDSLCDLKFQKQFEDFRNFNFGFRNFLVKLRNSFNYIAFRDLNNKDFICGKDNFIFDVNHIKYSLGIAYDGKEKNKATVDKIKFMKEGLEKRGVKLICFMIPSKEAELSGYLPNGYRNINGRPTNYGDLREGFKKNNIPEFDLYDYFAAKVSAGPYPFYTKTGSHWSIYGASFAQDTLLGYLSASLGKTFPQYKRTGVEMSDTARGDDKDFEGALNLFFSLNQPQYMYPKLEMVESTKNNYRPKVIIIGDSFVWQLKTLGIMKFVFSDDSKFWYYFNNASVPLGDQPWGSLKDLNIIHELESSDCVLLEGSMGTTDWYPFGVADYYYEHVVVPGILEAVKQNVKGNKNWTDNLMKNDPEGYSQEELITQAARRVCRDRSTIVIKAANNKFVCAGGDEQKELLANRDAASDWETYNMLQLANDRVAIYSHKNKFLSAELAQHNEITSTRTNIGDWEMFAVEGKGDGFVAFKASNGKYLSLDVKSQRIVASANSVGQNEKFKIVT
ncbi:MAG: alginate O-acetyltransferase AlgX-related protein, partial [Bacteroidia bacterium]